MGLPRPSLAWARAEDSLLGDDWRSHICRFYSTPRDQPASWDGLECLLALQISYKTPSLISPPFSDLWMLGAAKRQRPDAPTARLGIVLAPSCLRSSCWWTSQSFCGEKDIHTLLSSKLMLPLPLNSAPPLCHALEAQG